MSLSINEAVEKRLQERREAEAARIEQQQLEASHTTQLEAIASKAFCRFILDGYDIIFTNQVEVDVKRIANENYAIRLFLNQGTICVHVAMLDQSGWEYKLDSRDNAVVRPNDSYRVTRNGNGYHDFEDFIDALVYATVA